MPGYLVFLWLILPFFETHFRLITIVHFIDFGDPPLEDSSLLICSHSPLFGLQDVQEFAMCMTSIYPGHLQFGLFFHSPAISVFILQSILVHM
jgi:hypothetical protein